MSLAGLILLSPTGKPIISTPFRPPSLAHIYTTAFLSALERSRSLSSTSTNDHPGRESIEGGEVMRDVIWVGENEGVVCWVKKGGLWVLCPVAREANPLSAFRFLETFLSTLTDYIGDISEAAVKDNFDIVYQLLEEMLDSGSPLTTEPNLLRDIVLPPSLLNKVLSLTGVSGLGPPQSSTQPFSSLIPWRRAGVKYASNEIFFDFIEKLDVVLDRKGSPIKTQKTGRIEANARLSGTPDLLMSFTNPASISTPFFHPSIRLPKYQQSRSLSFIPPDGNFQLMSYAISRPSPSKAKSIMPSPSNDGSEGGVKLNVKVKLDTSEGSNGGKFRMTISPTHPSRPVENLLLKWHLGSNVLPEKVSASIVSSSSNAFGGGGGVSPSANDGSEGGSWEYDAGSEMLIWRIALLQPRSPPRTLTGSFQTSSSPFPSPSTLLTYTIHQHTLSGLKIAGLKVSNDRLPDGGERKIFRGVRGRVEGRIEARW